MSHLELAETSLRFMIVLPKKRFLAAFGMTNESLYWIVPIMYISDMVGVGLPPIFSRVTAKACAD